MYMTIYATGRIIQFDQIKEFALETRGVDDVVVVVAVAVAVVIVAVVVDDSDSVSVADKSVKVVKVVSTVEFPSLVVGVD